MGQDMQGWQAAAWSVELGRERPLPRRLNDVPLALYRLASGTPVALHDRCPHQGAPLSMGRLVEDRLQCAFHGLGFNAEGRCDDPRVHASVRDSQRVRVFPLRERDGLVWIWMQDTSPPQDAADPAGFVAAAEVDGDARTQVTRLMGDLEAARAQVAAMPPPEGVVVLEDHFTPGNALFTHHFRRVRPVDQLR